MTAVAAAVGRTSPAAVPWRRLTWVAWRQHRAALAVFAALAALIAVVMAVTGVLLHPYGHRVSMGLPYAPSHLFDVTVTIILPALLGLPVLAGLFVGAPLVAREFETGSARFTWVQGTDRGRLLMASVLPVAVLLAAIAIGLGLEYRWWATPLLSRDWVWHAGLFGLNPLPLTGWIIFAFCLGVFLGAAIARTVAAMAATVAGYAVLIYTVATNWRYHYLPPLRRAIPAHFSTGGYSTAWTFGPGQPSVAVSSYLGWPDGRPFTGSWNHPAAWFSQHHFVQWVTYQPGSRWLPFQLIEFGWLVALAAILIAATVVLIRRRAA